ncbi:MAG: tryptophan-rich sensory protein, partial [Clostridia bacterium]|nr:tryptophan-rich sensory protein [Clostridia bacterium]
TLYYVQLFFNFCWSFIFFSLGSYLFAFIWIIILWVLIIATTLEFNKIEPKAAYLMIPYIIWVTFASVLNFSVYLLN